MGKRDRSALTGITSVLAQTTPVTIDLKVVFRPFSNPRPADGAAAGINGHVEGAGGRVRHSVLVEAFVRVPFIEHAVGTPGCPRCASRSVEGRG